MNERLSKYIHTVIHRVMRPHQRRHLLAVLTNRYTVFLGPRQETGKSFVLSFAAVLMAGGFRGTIDGAEVVIPPHDVQLLSKSADTAQNLIREVGRHVAGLERAAGMPVRHDKLWSLTRAALAGGKYIFAHSSNPSAIQGFTGSTAVDEWSKLDESEQETYLSQALSVGASREYMRVAMATNADYENSYVHRFLRSPEFAGRRERMHIMEIDIHGIHPSGLPQRLLDIEALMHPDDWRRFFLNHFVAGTSGAFDGALSRMKQAGQERRTGRCVISLDPAFEKHSFGIAVSYVGEGRIHVAHAERVWRPTLGNIIQRIDELAAEFNAARYVIDPGSVGYNLAKHLESRHGSRVVKAPPNDAALHRWVQAARQVMVNGGWSYEHGARIIESELARIQYDEKEKVRVPEITVPDAPRGCLSHCDVAMAVLSTLSLDEFSRMTNVESQVGEPFEQTDIERNMGLGHLGARKFTSPYAPEVEDEVGGFAVRVPVWGRPI